MKRTWIKRGTVPMRRTKLRVKGHSDTAELKEEIQRLVREIVMIRDGGCIFKKEQGHICTGFAPKSGHLVLQADHLLSRSNSATYADTRLIVCVCQGIHGWKSVGSNLRKAEYDKRVKQLLASEIVSLWERCETERFTSSRKGAYDWKLEIAALNKQLKDMSVMDVR